MERAELRLECLKIASNHTTNKTEVLARAKEYFEFVSEKELDTAKPESAKLTGGTGRQPAR